MSLSDIPVLTEAQIEAERLARICNACRYCEGVCAVFPALERRRTFLTGDLNYLANLCHNCGACYHDCQYAPPHEFAVNVPQTLSRVRAESYASYVWPKAFAPLFERNGLAILVSVALSVALFIGLFMALSDPAIMFGRITREGAFYAIMPHNAMALLFGLVFFYVMLAFAMGVRAFWRDIRAGAPPFAQRVSVWQAVHDIGTLRYLDGEGAGCGNQSERPEPRRRLFHHLTFYGFMFCLASTSIATLYHYLGGWQAPYDFFSLPVVLGTVGGLGITVGPLGLYWLKRQRDPALGTNADHKGMDNAFLLVLAAVGISGLALMLLRATPLMGTVLALHLGLVMAFFLAMPYGKFVHGIYRAGALLFYAIECHREKNQAG